MRCPNWCGRWPIDPKLACGDCLQVAYCSRECRDAEREDQKVEAILRDAELPEDRAADIRRKLERARLTFRVMHATADLLLNEALKEAGVDYAGERLAIIAAVSKGF